VHRKEINTLLKKNLPLLAMGGILALEVSIVKPERAEETLEVFFALSH